jgi:hypothetical protein
MSPSPSIHVFQAITMLLEIIRQAPDHSRYLILRCLLVQHRCSSGGELVCHVCSAGGAGVCLRILSSIRAYRLILILPYLVMTSLFLTHSWVSAFQTLGVIYEERGQNQKALDIFLVGAHLKPKDKDMWYRLSQSAMYAACQPICKAHPLLVFDLDLSVCLSLCLFVFAIVHGGESMTGPSWWWL